MIEMKNQHSVFRVIQYSAILLSVLFGLASCNNHPEKNTSNGDFNKIDSLRSTFLIIEDSLLHTWNIMINDDNKKIKSLKRLVEEVIYAGAVDSVITDELLSQVLQLKSIRYTMKTMADSDLIDHYDSSSSATIMNVIELASSHEEFERNIIMNELIDEINQSQGKVLFYRIDYDDMAKAYNRFITQNEPIMKEIDSDRERHKLPLFELSSE